MKVLIVSDDRALLRHVSRFLGTFGYETEQVANYQRAAEIADSISADLLLVDSEPDFDRALGLCRAVSERTGSGSHYTLLMVDKRSPNRLLDAVAAGADDILLKPIVYGEVLRRLRAGAKAVEFRRRAGRQRRRDSVTGLLTYAAFQARLQAAGASQAYREEPFACVTIAIDFVEATLCDVGQHAEHTLLGEVGSLVERLCDNERADLAHFGNGQFCVSLPGTTIAEALQLAEKVRSEIGKN
jgi:PleD family two-component response regulator